MTSYFSKKIYDVGTHKKHVTEVLLLSIYNMLSSRNKKNVNLQASKSWLYKWILIIYLSWISNEIW